MSIEELKLLQSNIISKNKTCNLIGMIVMGSIIFFTIFFCLLVNKMALFACFFIICYELVFFLIIFVIVNGSDIKLFYREFKKIFVQKSLEKFFGNINYNFTNGFSREYVNSI